jgi:inhibitor of cysteine peptidase
MLDRLSLRWSLVVVLLAMLLLVAGCGGMADAVQPDATPEGGVDSGELEGAVVLGAEDLGRTVALSAGQVLVISLASNPTTGYSWEMAEGDAAVVQQVGEVEFSPSAPVGEPLVGSGGTETFRFEAAGQGQTTLTLVYHRPWEKGVEPLETFSVEVVVR